MLLLLSSCLAVFVAIRQFEFKFAASTEEQTGCSDHLKMSGKEERWGKEPGSRTILCMPGSAVVIEAFGRLHWALHYREQSGSDR
jgi:hypothetical protein